MTARLIDTGPVAFHDGHAVVWRPARTWALDGRTVLTIVTETDEASTSVERSREGLRDLLSSGIYRGSHVRIIAHRIRADGDHYAEDTGWWEHVTADTLRGLLGPSLDDTTPTGPVVSGVYPSRHTVGRR